MSDSAVYLFQGRILWREVPNLVNDGEKRRPLIIISSNRDIAAQPVVLCVACSHSTAMLEKLRLSVLRVLPSLLHTSFCAFPGELDIDSIWTFSGSVDAPASIDTAETPRYVNRINL